MADNQIYARIARSGAQKAALSKKKADNQLRLYRGASYWTADEGDKQWQGVDVPWGQKAPQDSKALFDIMSKVAQWAAKLKKAEERKLVKDFLSQIRGSDGMMSANDDSKLWPLIKAINVPKNTQAAESITTSAAQSIQRAVHSLNQYAQTNSMQVDPLYFPYGGVGGQQYMRDMVPLTTNRPQMQNLRAAWLMNKKGQKEQANRLGRTNWDYKKYHKDLADQYKYQQLFGLGTVSASTKAYGKRTLPGVGHLYTSQELKDKNLRPGPAYAWNQSAKTWQYKSNLAGIVSKQNFATESQQFNRQSLLNIKLSRDDVASTIPPMVRQIVKANSQFVSTGFGPVGKNSLPLYCARFYDPMTNRVKTLPSPSTKYVNPKNVTDVIRYYQARVLTSWNKFVRSQQNLFSILTNARDGKYIKGIMKKSLFMKSEDAPYALELSSIKQLVRSILNNERPYGMDFQQQQDVLDNYQNGQYSKLIQTVERAGKDKQKRLATDPQDKLMGNAIKAKYAQAFGSKGKNRVNNWNRRIQLPHLKGKTEILSLYPQQIHNFFKDTASLQKWQQNQQKQALQYANKKWNKQSLSKIDYVWKGGMNTKLSNYLKAVVNGAQVTDQMVQLANKLLKSKWYWDIYTRNGIMGQQLDTQQELILRILPQLNGIRIDQQRAKDSNSAASSFSPVSSFAPAPQIDSAQIESLANLSEAQVKSMNLQLERQAGLAI